VGIDPTVIGFGFSTYIFMSWLHI